MTITNLPIMKRFSLFALSCLLGLSSQAQEKMNVPNGYRVETIPIPDNIIMGVGGMAFENTGTLIISTREGQVWRYKNDKFQLIADGLHEALGLLTNPDNSDILVMQRPELTRLIDLDNDGRTDRYETVNGDWGLTDNYHEYAFGPVRDSKGNLYGTLNTSLSWKGWAGSSKWDIGRVHDGKMGRAAKYRGWCFQITPDGTFVPFASGMRSPAGIGINKKDEIFYTDNQGDWNGSSTLQHVVKGRFHGHPSSLMDHPDFAGKDLNKIPVEEYKKLRHPPAVFFPHGDLANSPGEPVFNETGGKFGPFDGQIFVGDSTKSVLMRVNLEKIKGEYQGAVFPFIRPMQCGIIRNVFGPDGSLWLGQTGRGWRSIGPVIYGIQRVIWDGKTTPTEIQSIKVTKKGFKLTFTRPVDMAKAKELSNYEIKNWTYLYQPEYGSPKHGLKKLDVTKAKISMDGFSVSLDVPMEIGKVYQFIVNVPDNKGTKLANNIGWYTLNATR
ncbi:PQQ-dependent sugar dehydrogenase [Verrucomicrobia bacterium]|nr:PQQ-dependent sugar dehydrogenase [Verrucomicrobiota bacterium]